LEKESYHRRKHTPARLTGKPNKVGWVEILQLA